MNDNFERNLVKLAVGCVVLITLTLTSAIGVDIYLKVKNHGTRHTNVLEVKP